MDESEGHRRSRIAGRLFVECLVVVFALFALFVGVALIGGGGNSPGNQAAGSNQDKQQQQPSGDKRESGQAAGGGGGVKSAIVKVGGTPGIRFSGDVGNIATTRSVDGVIPAQYAVKFSSDTRNMDSVYVDLHKQSDASANFPPGTLSVQIVVDGKVVQKSSSSARDGYVSIDWSPS